MQAEGTRFRTGVDVGVDVTGERAARAATTRSSSPSAPPCRATCRCPGASSTASMQAMDFLPPANRVALGETVEGQVTAEGKDVIVIGGGDTGADCIGTAHRQGARSVTSLEIMPQPPAERAAHQPWPTYPMIFRVASAHEEGGDRVYAVSHQRVPRRRDGKVARAAARTRCVMGDSGFEEVEGTEREIPAQLVLLAMGFLGPQRPGCVEQLGVDARRARQRRARRRPT